MEKIKLTRGQYALVDNEDYWLNNYNWFALKTEAGFYASRNDKLGNGLLLMHRIIMGEPQLTVDHINGDTLDNRKQNLRLATHQQQMHNRKKESRGNNKYKGVYWDKERNKWRANIHYNNKTIQLGRYDKEIEAARAYNKAARKYFGEYARLNKL